MAVEAKRGCGWRKVGGLYLVGGGLSAPCDRMPFHLERCRTCGGGIKFTRGPQWLQPDFFPVHDPIGDTNRLASLVPFWEKQIREVATSIGEDRSCCDEAPCPVCRNRDDFGPHLMLWIGRKHYTPEGYLRESRELGVSRRLSALPKGLVLGETWVLLAHLDAVPPKDPTICTRCEMGSIMHKGHHDYAFKGSGPASLSVNSVVRVACDEFQTPKPTPGIFCAFVPRAVELILKQSDATPERVEKEAKRGVTVVAVPDDDKDHQGSVWDKDDDSQPELPGVAL
jgi:hypothetical protein